MKPSRFISANRAAFHSLLQKLRASSKRSLTTAPRGRALSAGFSAHCVENSSPQCLHLIRGSTRFSLRLLDQRLAVRTLELDRHADVLRFGGQIGQAEAQRIGAELLDHVDRIDAVALRLRHSLAVAVEDLRMDEHVVERHFAHVVQALSTIRATQSVMMSRLVISTLVG